ncbi:MAG: DUF2971 domain-containing protein [Calditrichaeota bacterium]|nr:DUF2971 domain-containing protein [Calditrichota bacterium]
MSYDFQIMAYSKQSTSTEIYWAIRNCGHLITSLHSAIASPPFYHYTDFAGLKGILSDRTMWFSHIRTMNDPSELDYGRSVVLKALEAHARQEHCLPEVLTFLDRCADLLYLLDRNQHQFYVACFSEHGNRLSQWRGYASGGHGYCMKFNINTATQYGYLPGAGHTDATVHTRKIVYDPMKQSEIARKGVNAIVQGFKKTTKNGRLKTLEDRLNHTVPESADFLLDLLLTFKHAAFEEEAEWRMLLVMDSGFRQETIQYRNGCAGVTPFIAMRISKLQDGSQLFPIETITAGPGLDPLTSIDVTKMLVGTASKSDHWIQIQPDEITVEHAGFRLR